MRWRELIAAVAVVVLAPPVVFAQSAKSKRIGWLAAGRPDDPSSRATWAIFTRKLKLLGWSEDAVVFDARYVTQDAARFLAAAKELLAGSPDVIVAMGGTAAGAFKGETRTPIVFTNVTDPVGQALVSNLGHPGANI